MTDGNFSIARSFFRALERPLGCSAEIEFLDSGARDLLLEARKFYRDAHLSERTVVMDGKAVLLLPWTGDLANNALVPLLRSLGLMSGSNEGLVVRCEGWDLNRLSDACSDIVSARSKHAKYSLDSKYNLIIRHNWLKIHLIFTWN